MSVGGSAPGPASRRRGRWWLLGVGLVVVGLVAGWVLARRLESPAQVAARAAAPEASWVTVGVEERVLSATVITRGDVAPELSVAVGPPGSVEGTPVVTELPVAVGGEVAEGDRVVVVSGRPVFVLAGAVPVYRSMRPAMRGADVEQLQAALVRGGCVIGDEAGVFGPATKECVAGLYAAAGFEPVPSSATEAADLAAAAQAVTAAESAVRAARASFDAKAAGAGSQDVLAARLGVAGAQRGLDDAVAAAKSADGAAAAEVLAAQAEVDRLVALTDADPAEVAAARERLATASAAVLEVRRAGESQVATARDAVTLAQAGLTSLTAEPDVAVEYEALAAAVAGQEQAVASFTALQAASGPTVPLGEVVFVPRFPARVQTAPAGLGPVESETGAAGPLVSLAAGELVVSVRVRADERDAVRVGMPVVLLDEQTNTTYDAAVASIEDTPTTGPDGSVGYAMRVTPASALPDVLAGVNVRVTITAASSEGEVLVVPLAAVSSKADGSTFVSVLPEGAVSTADPVEVPVTAGLSADGFVAVEPVTVGALAAGDRVVVGR